MIWQSCTALSGSGLLFPVPDAEEFKSNCLTSIRYRELKARCLIRWGKPLAIKLTVSRTCRLRTCSEYNGVVRKAILTYVRIVFEGPTFPKKLPAVPRGPCRTLWVTRVGLVLCIWRSEVWRGLGSSTDCPNECESPESRSTQAHHSRSKAAQIKRKIIILWNDWKQVTVRLWLAKGS